MEEELEEERVVVSLSSGITLYLSLVSSSVLYCTVNTEVGLWSRKLLNYTDVQTYQYANSVD
jgi:hypothetical protein